MFRRRSPTLRLREESIEWVEVEGKVVVMDLRSSSFVKLNGSGTRLWHRLVEGSSEERLAEGLVEEFGIDEAAARADAEAFVATLRERDLLLPVV